jgi:NADH dehydrogenase/NADH:ubiquinone oxidoreductase subunit G
LSLVKQIFADGMKSSMVTSTEEGWPTGVTASFTDDLKKSFEGKVDSLDNADCVVVLDADLANNHQVLGFLVKRILPTGTKLIVVDSDSNDFDPFAEVKIKAARGTNVDVLTALKAAVNKLDVGPMAAKLGLLEDDLKAAGQVLSEAENPVFIYGRDLSAKEGKPALTALLELAGAVKNASVISTKGKANSMAASQLHLDVPFEAGKHQAFFVAMGDEDPSHRLIQRLEGANFLAVTATYHSKLTAIADVVIPVEMWAETEGHYINIDGRLQKTSKVLKSPDGILGSDEVLKSIGQVLGISTNDSWKQEISLRTPSTVISEA